MLALTSQPNEEQLFGASCCETTTDTVNYFLMFFRSLFSFTKAKNGFYFGFELKSDLAKYVIRCE